MRNENELPSIWKLTTVGEICREINYGYTASASEERCGPKFLRITDIQNGDVNWKGVPYCNIDEKNVAKFLLKRGDIVFARTGGTVGKSYIIKSIPEDTVFASYLIRLTAFAEIFPAFLHHYFQSASYWEQIELKKGGLQGNVNATTLSSINFRYVLSTNKSALSPELRNSSPSWIRVSRTSKLLASNSKSIVSQSSNPPLRASSLPNGGKYTGSPSKDGKNLLFTISPLLAQGLHPKEVIKDTMKAANMHGLLVALLMTTM